MFPQLPIYTRPGSGAQGLQGEIKQLLLQGAQLECRSQCGQCCGCPAGRNSSPPGFRGPALLRGWEKANRPREMLGQRLGERNEGA